MYFYCWLHSLVCGDCPKADSYWRLRAFWAGVKHRRDAYTPPKRCPSTDLWYKVWWLGAESGVDGLEF